MSTVYQELVDPDGLSRFLKERAHEFSGAFELERLGEGQSCLTFLVKGDGWEVVLRRPPRGNLPPTAFDVTREYRVMRALQDSGSSVPVPPLLALCEDKDVIGAPFYLMEKVNGVVVRALLPDNLSSIEDRRRMGEQLVDTLVALHRVDYRAIGLDGFGKPEGYLARQLKRMNQLWELARSREIPEIDEVGEWLGANLPEQSGTSIVHGDYKLDNVMLAPDPPARIVAVVDWEISTIGDPLADLGWMLYFWRDASDTELGLAASLVTHMDGFPTRGELMTRYADALGKNIDNVLWYVALAGWKIAIIMEGSYKRFLSGITDHPMFSLLDEAVPALARRARQAARGEFTI